LADTYWYMRRGNVGNMVQGLAILRGRNKWGKSSRKPTYFIWRTRKQIDSKVPFFGGNMLVPRRGYNLYKTHL